MKDVKEPTDWDRLEEFLGKHKDKGKVSVSGGGDPLYRYEENLGWWKKLFKITNKLNLRVDVHTREKMRDEQFWSKINRCVFSSDQITDDVTYLWWLIGRVKLRVTHLATPNTTMALIDKYLAFQTLSGCEFTVKQMAGYDDWNMYRKIKQERYGVFCLDAGDYNLYYMPDNTVTTKFMGN